MQICPSRHALRQTAATGVDVAGIWIVHSHNNSVFAKGIFACGEHVLFLRNLK